MNSTTIFHLRDRIHQIINSITDQEYREINIFLYHYGDVRYDELLKKTHHEVWSLFLNKEASPIFIESLLEYIGIQLRPSTLLKFNQFYHLFQELKMKMMGKILHGESIKEDYQEEERISFFDEDEVEKLMYDKKSTSFKCIPLTAKNAISGDELLDMDCNKYIIKSKDDWIDYIHPYFLMYFSNLFLCYWKIEIEHPYDLRTIHPSEDMRERALYYKDRLESLLQCIDLYDSPLFY
jgi:hypothetical protein